jgi:hypothetical protein
MKSPSAIQRGWEENFEMVRSGPVVALESLYIVEEKKYFFSVMLLYPF